MTQFPILLICNKDILHLILQNWHILGQNEKDLETNAIKKTLKQTNKKNLNYAIINRTGKLRGEIYFDTVVPL